MKWQQMLDTLARLPPDTRNQGILSTLRLLSVQWLLAVTFAGSVGAPTAPAVSSAASAAGSPASAAPPSTKALEAAAKAQLIARASLGACIRKVPGYPIAGPMLLVFSHHPAGAGRRAV